MNISLKDTFELLYVSLLSLLSNKVLFFGGLKVFMLVHTSFKMLGTCYISVSSALLTPLTAVIFVLKAIICDATYFYSLCFYDTH